MSFHTESENYGTANHIVLHIELCGILDQFDFTMARATQYKATGTETKTSTITFWLENSVSVLTLQRTPLKTLSF